MNILREIYAKKNGDKIINKILESGKIFTIGEMSEDVVEHFVLPGGYVVWGKPAVNHGGDEKNVLAEEIYHCYQIAKGDWKFSGMTRDQMLDLEIQAKEFAAQFDYKPFFKTQGFYVPTQMKIMAGDDYVLKKSYLDSEFVTQLPMYKNKPSISDERKDDGTYYHRGTY